MSTNDLEEWTRQIQSSSRPRILPVDVIPRRALLGLLGVIGGGLALGLTRSARADSCASGSRNPIEGPYYLGDPEETYDTGEGLIVQGRVLDETTCSPIAGATIVRWHANDLGFYEEFYRAKMVAKSDGTFAMSTIAPGQYANLARHIHWYVVADGYRPVIAQTQWADDETIAGTRPWDFSLVKA